MPVEEPVAFPGAKQHPVEVQRREAQVAADLFLVVLLEVVPEENLPVADMFGIYALERVFDFASTAVITALALLFFQSHESTGETSTALGTAAKTAGR